MLYRQRLARSGTEVEMTDQTDERGLHPPSNVVVSCEYFSRHLWSGGYGFFSG